MPALIDRYKIMAKVSLSRHQLRLIGGPKDSDRRYYEFVVHVYTVSRITSRRAPLRRILSLTTSITPLLSSLSVR